jgi:hypothetical protein
MGLAITLITALLALGWAKNAKKRTTKIATVLLALSSLIAYDPYLGISSYGIYFLIFFSFFSAIESMNSLRMTWAHHLFFVGSAVVITLFQLMVLIDFPFYIPKYPFAIFYIVCLALLWYFSKRKIFSRFGVLLVWLGVAVKWLLTSFW